MYLPMDTWAILMQVSPFGHSRIDGYLRLPETFRSLSRPSSALSAKAFPLCSFSLDLAECSSDTTFLFCFCLKSINLSFSAFSRFFWLFLSLYSVFKVQLSETFVFWLRGDYEIRTRDPLLARQVLSQLSYIPRPHKMGSSGLEPPTSRLSGVRSNQLSYKPIEIFRSLWCFQLSLDNWTV